MGLRPQFHMFQQRSTTCSKSNGKKIFCFWLFDWLANGKTEDKQSRNKQVDLILTYWVITTDHDRSVIGNRGRGFQRRMGYLIDYGYPGDWKSENILHLLKWTNTIFDCVDRTPEWINERHKPMPSHGPDRYRIRLIRLPSLTFFIFSDFCPSEIFYVC